MWQLNVIKCYYLGFLISIFLCNWPVFSGEIQEQPICRSVFSLYSISPHYSHGLELMAAKQKC